MKRIIAPVIVMGFCLSIVQGETMPYVNAKYGFTLSLPESWKHCRVVEKTTGWTPDIKAATLYFCLPTKDANWYESDGPGGYACLLAITVFTHGQLKKIEAAAKESGGMPGEDISVFRKNSRYAFSYSGPQACPDDLHERIGEIEGIMKTFSLPREQVPE